MVAGQNSSKEKIHFKMFQIKANAHRIYLQKFSWVWISKPLLKEYTTHMCVHTCTHLKYIHEEISQHMDDDKLLIKWSNTQNTALQFLCSYKALSETYRIKLPHLIIAWYCSGLIISTLWRTKVKLLGLITQYMTKVLSST